MCDGGGERFAVVHFQMQHAVLKFTVVDDADILDAQMVASKNGGNRGDSARLIQKIHVQLIYLL